MNYKYSYLVTIQFLGFRFHGWQKQSNLKTVHSVIDKTLMFVLGDVRFKTMGVGRTDAKVSSTQYLFQLFVDEELGSDDFIESFNYNSPSDIRTCNISQIEETNFNIIQHPKIKEYRYYFSFGTKNHPYSSPFITGVLDELNIEQMQKGAKLFQGEHNYTMYCTKPNERTKVIRSVDHCEILINEDLKASFFPEKSYVLIIRSSGFLRNQIRLIMGALFELGKGNYDLDFIKSSLTGVIKNEFIRKIAPASGLHLHEITLKK